ncbi:aminomethyl-transferring glycine dehydrogenase subunit GcvPA [Terrisporobacter hibernicus]|uniref:Multifunctional fusion protein n=1 Tax=Terrisporobacter hibernicus TaxID=2813371 RepID=A0AAX2ZLT7_9FIRM|nr:aminomethyl-transferring glycine dehydrogenase subunit GcvPA [Terrisporobacter hibernicus]
MIECMELKRTKLFSTHEKLNAKMFEFVGWEMPLEYTSATKEHDYVRRSAGLFDVSHMGEVEVKGKDAFNFIQYLITNDITNLKAEEIIYSPMCYENGMTVDDMLVYMVSEENYLLVINAGNIDKDYEWITKQSEKFDVNINNISSNISQLAIQGPKAEDILSKLVNINLSDIEFYKFKNNVEVCGEKCIVSRTGYTGEDGFEIYCDENVVDKIWNDILEVGKENITPVGLGARDTLRAEVNLPLYGNELSEKISPIEVGLGIFVKLNKENFIGKEALISLKSQKIQRKLVAFEMQGKGMIRSGYEIEVDGSVIGFVTTGLKSPTLDKFIGMAIIDSNHAKIGSEIGVRVRKKLVSAVIVKKPFYKKQYKKSEIVKEEYKQYSYIPATHEDEEKMLKACKVNSIDDLFSDIPDSLKLKRDLQLEESKSELEVSQIVKSIADKNISTEELTCFLGAGAYDHYIPSIIKHITSRSEFNTAYTPYQAEISQGTLQSIFEFQSMIAEITKMDIANASMYDGATAAVEGCLLAVSKTRRKKVVVGKTVHPETRKVLKTYLQFNNCEVVEVDYDRESGMTDLNRLNEVVDEDTACVLLQNPNFFGVIEDVDEVGQIAHDKKAMYVLSVNPITLSVLKSPGEVGADVAVGDAQPLGNALNYGGPYVGFLAIKSGLIRKMPGRVVGQTVDRDGNRCYCLTLQTREQHVRREKATSNICSNQGLCALNSAIYMATMGKKGYEEVAMQNMQKSHYAVKKISEGEKFQPLFKGRFFNEFVVKSPIEVDELNKKLLENNILGGYDLGKDYPELAGCTMICVTEKRSVDEIDKLMRIMEGM